MAVNLSDLARIQRQSVHASVDNLGSIPYFVLSLASYGDTMPEWGTNPVYRDYLLRKFWPTEPWLAATISSLCARNAAFSWTLEGPPRTCARIQETLHLSEMGKGWIPLIQKASEDLLSQDNGAFIEIIREGSGPNGAFLGLTQLDAGQCVRTGNLEYPVLYTDREAKQHKLKWHQVLMLTDFPSPVESMNGMQMCAVSRILRSAQILRDTAIYQQEKVGGRNPGKLYVVSGVSTQVLEDALSVAANNADNKGLTRYQTPAILGTLDPTATVSIAEIALKNLPDGFDTEKDMKWYIALLALAFGCEYQDLAPLPGGGLGTSQQSTILHLKARGKGPELFQKLIEHSFNFQILPQNVTFKFDEKDYEAQRIEAEVKFKRAETREKDITSGAITPQVARQMMQDDGDLSDEYLQMLAGEDVTDVDTVQDDERHQEAPEVAQQPAPEVPVAIPPGADQQGSKAPDYGEKFNAFHAADGRFTSGSGGGAVSFNRGPGVRSEPVLYNIQTHQSNMPQGKLIGHTYGGGPSGQRRLGTEGLATSASFDKKWTSEMDKLSDGPQSLAGLRSLRDQANNGQRWPVKNDDFPDPPEERFVPSKRAAQTATERIDDKLRKKIEGGRGRQMTAKYPGRDYITDEAFRAGTSIIYNSEYGVAILPRSKAAGNWIGGILGLVKSSDRPGTPDEPLKDQLAAEQIAKQLGDGDYWAKKRTELEREYEAEVAEILADVRERVAKRISQEVRRGD